MLYSACKQYLLAKLKGTGLKSNPYTTQKALTKRDSSPVHPRPIMVYYLHAALQCPARAGPGRSEGKRYVTAQGPGCHQRGA